MWCLSTDLKVQSCCFITHTCSSTPPDSCLHTLPLFSYPWLHFLVPLSSCPPAVIKRENQTTQAKLCPERRLNKNKMATVATLFVEKLIRAGIFFQRQQRRVFSLFVVCMCVAWGSQRRLVNVKGGQGGLIPVVLHHTPPSPTTHTYKKLLHRCCWHHSEGLLAFINVSVLQLSTPPPQNISAALTPALAGVHIWRGRRQVVTPRWAQSKGSRFLFALFSPSGSVSYSI